MEEDKGYEVVDKRGSNAESEEPAAEPQEETTETAGEMPSVDVYSAIGMSINMLAGLAWQWMGLIPNSGSGKIETDIAQARIAIDSVVFLFDKIAPQLSEEDRRQGRSMINDLQVNFVQQAGKTE